MAHTLVPLDQFAERLVLERNNFRWPHSTAHIAEYCQALNASSREYFFMRGVEGYMANRHSSPVYKNERWAQEAWKDGYYFASEYLGNINEHDFHEFNRSWLEAYQTSNFHIALDREFYQRDRESYWSAIFGLYARLKAHQLYQGQSISDFVYGVGANRPRAHNPKFETHPKKGTEPMAQQLYKDVKTGIIGIRVGEDDEGKTVLKTDKGFQAFDKVKKVIPHTICVQNQNGTRSHFRAPKDKYMKGDILLCYADTTGPFMLSVRETDTEKADATELKDETVIKFLHKVRRSK
jgi:hypothetical protein